MQIQRSYMPKNLLLSAAFAVALVAALGLPSAQAQRLETPRSYPGKQANEEMSQATSRLSAGLGTESTTALWTFDFSGSTGLSILDDANGGARWKVVSALEPNLTSQNFGPTFNSTSGGFLCFD